MPHKLTIHKLNRQDLTISWHQLSELFYLSLNIFYAELSYI